MDMKTAPVSDKRPASSKEEEKKVPSRSFREVMAQKESPRFPRRGGSIFDLASKGNKKTRERESIESCPVRHPIEKTSHVTTQESAEVLPADVSSLVEEMADYVTMESFNGISKTTVEIGKEGSLFAGTLIEIDHYDTAPQSFNLQLIGSPESVELFLKHLGALQLSLNAHEMLKQFEVHLMSPILKTELAKLNSRGKSKEERKKELSSKGSPGASSIFTPASPYV